MRLALRRAPIALRLSLPLLAAGALAAACGGDSSGPAQAAATAPGHGTVITTSQRAGSTYLTDGAGRSIYLWVADSKDTSTCSGACASVWPPVTSKGTPTASGSVVRAKLGLISRSGGGEQVTYAGHPLYYYAGDTGSGATNGQGSNGFGAKWWLLAPAGSAITSPVGSGSTASTPGGGSAGYGGGYG